MQMSCSVDCERPVANGSPWTALNYIHEDLLNEAGY